MGRKWTYCVVYAIIQIQFFRGAWEELFNAGDNNVYALPGSDVNLTCQIMEKDLMVQMQWSKVTDEIDLIVVYHPQYGFHCMQGGACESRVAAVETLKDETKWTLYLRNISSGLSGKYECSFTLYPRGTKTMVYNLIVEPYTQDEHNYTIEIETNRTLEIPCFQNTSSEISPRFTFSWLVEKDGVEEVLFTYDDHVSNSTSFKGRVGLGADYGLHLSPVQVQDDGRTFSCCLRITPLKVWKTSTTVKVFAKPEIFMTVENTTMDVLGETVFTCLLKNVFPKASIVWLIDGRFLQGNEEGIYITNEEKNGSSGFRELKSILTRMHDRPSQSNNMTVWCMGLSPGPGNKTWNTSSQPITFSLDSGTAPTKHLPNVTGSTLGAQPFPDTKVSPTRYLATSSMAIVEENVLTPDTTPQREYTSRAAASSDSGSWPFPSTSPPKWLSLPHTSTEPHEPDSPGSPPKWLSLPHTSTEPHEPDSPGSPPKWLSLPHTSTGSHEPDSPGSPPKWLSLPHTSTGPHEPDSPVSWTPTDVYTSAPSDASSAPHDVTISTTKEFPDVLTTANGTTKINHGHVTGITVNEPRDGMSWPVLVAALLFFCTLLFGLGVRKWCQYQNEMERPPPFKPPPPPIKYVCIQEPTGRDLPCHEMEVL